MGGVRRPFYYIDSIIYHLKKIVNVLLWKKYIESINEQISNAFVRLHKPFRQKSTILMVDFCHLP